MKAGFKMLSRLRSKTVFFGFLFMVMTTSVVAISPATVLIAQTNSVSALAAGGTFSLASLSDGTVRSWGWNKYGQLGNGNTLTSNVPVPVSGLAGVKAIVAGTDFGLALKTDGSVWGWGNNHYGQLGNGGNQDSPVPVRVSGLAGVIAVAAGSAHGLALKADGTVWVWGLSQLILRPYLRKKPPQLLIRLFGIRRKNRPLVDSGSNILIFYMKYGRDNPGWVG
jgi:hypothetical protein